MARETFLLPGGQTTKSADKYVDEWRAVGRRLETIFVGYRMVAFDPGFLLSSKDGKNLDLSFEQASMIFDAVNKK